MALAISSQGSSRVSLGAKLTQGEVPTQRVESHVTKQPWSALADSRLAQGTCRCLMPQDQPGHSPEVLREVHE